MKITLLSDVIVRRMNLAAINSDQATIDLLQSILDEHHQAVIDESAEIQRQAANMQKETSR